MADSPRLTAEERADLVAYLDGELPENRSRFLAEKLGQSASGRREAESLRSTWQLLDLLDRPLPDPSFASRTVSMAVTSPDLGGERGGRSLPLVRRLAGMLAIAGVIALGAGIGFVGARWAWPDRTARLARDLTIAERLDDYRAVGSFEFLRLLDESTLFPEASD